MMALEMEAAYGGQDSRRVVAPKIIIIIIISFIQDVHTYIPETNHVSKVDSVAAIPHVLLMVHITLSSILNSCVLLHWHFLQCVCCAQYSCFV
jgi:hypothetical protein